VRIFLCTQPADMRRSFDGLAAMTKDILREDPLSGHLFVFRSRRGDRVKILWWSSGGYCLWYKRLEEGTFRFPEGGAGEAAGVEVASGDLSLLLEGIDLAGARRRRRYEPARGAAGPA
jgi:transposase